MYYVLLVCCNLLYSQGWGQLHENDYDYDYNYTVIMQGDYNYDNREKCTISIMIMITFGCKCALCNQSKYMFLHASLHKYTPAYANKGNMYLFHVLLAKATVIDVIICDYSIYFV